jgi:hypothetical protein
MSQNDFSIADQPGASFLSELNSQIQALATLSSGPTAPTTTYAYQFWYDTTNSLLKMRNGGNTQWITIGNPATDTSVDMYIANALRARLNDTGLGVGVSNPAYALDVSGDVNVTGVFRVGGVDIQNSHRSGLVNMFRNPFMEVAQRGTSGTVTAGTGAYTLDGWAVSPIGANVSWQQAGPVGNATTYSLTSFGLLGASGLTGCTVTQRIESNMAAQIAGKRVTVQFLISNQTGATLTPTISTYYPTATDNYTSAVADLGAGTQLQTIPSGGQATVAYTFTTNSLATRGYGFDLAFGSQLNGTGKNVYISAADIRFTPDAPLGLNNAPPRPEYRPHGPETILCHKYYWRLGNGILIQGYGQGSGANTYQTITLPTLMRATPVLSTTFVSGINVQSQSAIGLWAGGFQIRITSAASGDYASTLSAAAATSEL